jgi:hypothetical protein
MAGRLRHDLPRVGGPNYPRPDDYGRTGPNDAVSSRSGGYGEKTCTNVHGFGLVRGTRRGAKADRRQSPEGSPP